MNLREKLAALVAGKKLNGVYGHRFPHYCVWLEDDRIVDSDGCSRDFAIAIEEATGLWVPVNPHKTGTFAWARFEACENGKLVRSLSTASWRLSASNFAEYEPWCTRHFNATDWEIEP